jgi:hypothetical protein
MGTRIFSPISSRILPSVLSPHFPITSSPIPSTSSVPAMALQERLQLANRMHLELQRALGQGIDVPRMLADPRYAVDVLLVCDALRENGLDALAARWRLATELDIDLDAIEQFGAAAPAPHEPEPTAPMRWLASRAR